jgi:hypothetical protein
VARKLSCSGHYQIQKTQKNRPRAKFLWVPVARDAHRNGSRATNPRTKTRAIYFADFRKGRIFFRAIRGSNSPARSYSTCAFSRMLLRA